MGESFGLSRIYIPLRGYYERPEGKEKNQFLLGLKVNSEKVALWVEDTLINGLLLRTRMMPFELLAPNRGGENHPFLKCGLPN